MYFVIETKENKMFDKLRPIEMAKAKCGKKHFEALENEVVFEVVDSFEDFIERQVIA